MDAVLLVCYMSCTPMARQIASSQSGGAWLRTGEDRPSPMVRISCQCAGKQLAESSKTLFGPTICAYTANVLTREIGAFAEGTHTEDRPTA